VQNPDDVSHEKEIIDFVRQHETSKKEETSGIYENYQPVTEIQESALTKIEIEENGKVSEFSNGSSSQGRKKPSVIITERVVESFTQRPLSAFSSNDDDKCQSSSDIPQRIVDCK
jgi:ADP-glucose pyrophosphorylase